MGMFKPELIVTLATSTGVRALAHRAVTALRALSDLCSGVSASALALPLFDALSETFSIVNLPLVLGYDARICQYLLDIRTYT